MWMLHWLRRRLSASRQYRPRGGNAVCRFSQQEPTLGGAREDPLRAHQRTFDRQCANARRGVNRSHLERQRCAMPLAARPIASSHKCVRPAETKRTHAAASCGYSHQPNVARSGRARIFGNDAAHNAPAQRRRRMAHFQLPVQNRPFSTLIGGTRLFLSGTTGDEAILIETGKSLTLELAGLSSATPAPAITQVPLASVMLQKFAGIIGLKPPLPSGPDIVSLSPLSGRGPRTITAVRPGAVLLFVNGSNPLAVFVGDFKNHRDMEHDLIANVFSPPTRRRCTFSMRVLFNNEDNLFNEKSTFNERRWGPLACGTVSKVGGAAVFFGKLDYDYQAYYRPPVAGRTPWPHQDRQRQARSRPESHSGATREGTSIRRRPCLRPLDCGHPRRRYQRDWDRRPFCAHRRMQRRS